MLALQFVAACVILFLCPCPCLSSDEVGRLLDWARQQNGANVGNIVVGSDGRTLVARQSYDKGRCMMLCVMWNSAISTGQIGGALTQHCSAVNACL